MNKKSATCSAIVPHSAALSLHFVSFGTFNKDYEENPCRILPKLILLGHSFCSFHSVKLTSHNPDVISQQNPM